MPEYLYPGVYVEEIDTGNKPIEGVSTSTVGFLGIAERGPTTAMFITSYADFVRSFGSYYQYKYKNTPAQAYLAYSVEGFFLNGGLRCWVTRVTSIDAANPAATASTTLANIKISAAGPGLTGNNIGYQVRAASGAPGDNTLFRLTIFYWSPQTTVNAADGTTATQIEDFDNVSTNPNASTYFKAEINSASNLVVVDQPARGTIAATAGIVMLGATAGDTKGSDGADVVENDFTGIDYDPVKQIGPTGLTALSKTDDVSILCCPDEHAFDRGTIAGLLTTQCDTLKDRFAILSSAAQEAKPGNFSPTGISQRGYSAFYYPWLNIVDPKTSLITLIPPAGHIAGIYARSDNNDNVAKDPANEQIAGIDSLQLAIDNQTQAQLNPIGINCLRFFRGQGNLVWGGRTTSPDPDWKYISVRRLFIFIEKSIQQGTQWVVFEPNDEPTWARVRRSVSDFLTGLWMQDMLQGATKDQAYFVRCDRTTMTQSDIDNGRLIVIVGIAPVKPAEFVIFRIGQWTGGSSVTEGQ
ncbi:MAG TPA: phage tail sheath C-terminal domain-containing protein [Bryobacteraceae bacterium]|nr:phage tail sheath C-terminal domain-containing protein [Bryobacteraceae bacterium]